MYSGHACFKPVLTTPRYSILPVHWSSVSIAYIRGRWNAQFPTLTSQLSHRILFLFPLSDFNHQDDYFLSLMVPAGYVFVASIHRTLTWTTGSLSCAQMLMHAIAHRDVRTPKESLHWKLILGRESLAAPGNRTCVSGVTVRCYNHLSYIPSWQFCG